MNIFSVSPKDIVNLVDKDNWPAVVLTGGLSTAAAAYYYYMGPKGNSKKAITGYTPPIYHPMELPESHSKIVPGPERIRISALCEGLQTSTRWIDDLPDQTMYEIFMRGHRKSANQSCMGYRKKVYNVNAAGDSMISFENKYTWMTYEEVRYSAQCIGSGLKNFNLAQLNGSKIGIYSPNRPEWDITQLACCMFGHVVVPLYDTQSSECQNYIINHTELSVIFCDDQSKVERILAFPESVPSLKTLVLFDEEIKDELRQKATTRGIDLLTYPQVLASGQLKLQPITPAKPEDLFVIMYTSGTTGMPKGVMMKHETMVTDIESIFRCYLGYDKKGAYFVDHEDCYISYLPQAHGFNQVCTGLILSQGGRIGYFHGDVKQLLEDAQLLKPTFFPMVPRLMNRLYAGVKNAVKSSRMKSFIMDKGLSAKRKEVSKGYFRRNSVYDKLIFGKIQNMLGGRVRGMVTGAAPVSSEVLEFVKCAIGCPVTEGYGQTETVAASTITLPGSTTVGTVGSPVPCCEIKLVDIPEMKYFANEDKGEVCFRGRHCFDGYYKQEEKTRETIDEDGWVHSGDVGEWTSDGNLKIIDRKKHIFKLAQGEYIAPEKVEGVYQECPVVAQIFVHGDSLRSCCVGICVPDEESFRQFAVSNGYSGPSKQNLKELCANKALTACLMRELNKIGKSKHLNPLELIKGLYLHPELLTPENGLLTPTLKTKRPEVRAFFKKQIDELYSAIDEDANAGLPSSQAGAAKL